MSRTYLVTVRVTGHDDRLALLAAAEFAEHVADHYRHNTISFNVIAPTRERLDDLFTDPAERPFAEVRCTRAGPPLPTEPDPLLANAFPYGSTRVTLEDELCRKCRKRVFGA